MFRYDGGLRINQHRAYQSTIDAKQRIRHDPKMRLGGRYRDFVHVLRIISAGTLEFMCSEDKSHQCAPLSEN
jgi:hypothetical protein